ncbi:MAG: amidohydrolase, partial [bacterium]|nr:amidohydrolase [bacterium]
MKIDSHHHFWQFNTDEYGWMSDEMDAIRRDFLPPDLEREIGGAGVDGAVSVQARQKLEETEWLLSMAEQHDFLRGVVGWAPLMDAAVIGVLEKLASRPKLKAVRHVLHDEPDDNYMLRDDFNRGIASLHHFGLVYDV